MKKRRRVEINIEHREISIFSRQSPQPGQPYRASAHDAAAILRVEPPGCPTCGSPELILLTDAVTRASLDVAALNQGMHEGRIHYHRSDSGQWWLCAKSLQQK